MRLVLALGLVLLACHVAAPAAAQDKAPLDYRPPVDAPVVDPFRVPPDPYGPGNRGVDYGAKPGTPVLASAAGEVAFAGQVGGSLHVVLLHADGLRTSYSFLDQIFVKRGQVVEARHAVGVARGPFHFGVRDGDRYLDPLAVLGGGIRVQLLPDEPLEPEAEAVEGSKVAQLLQWVPRPGVGEGAVDWLRGVVGNSKLSGWLHYGTQFTMPISLRVAAALDRFREQRSNCTSPEKTPGVPIGRRRAVLVGGLGATSSTASIRDVRTGELGYRPDDVVMFSYRGWSVAENEYGPLDTQVDLMLSGSRLRALVERTAFEVPGAPVDVLAHSQGGIVSRVAAIAGARTGLVVTLGTPHQGTDLATAGSMVSGGIAGAGIDAVLTSSKGTSIESRSVRQMSETSDFMAELRAAQLPAAVRFVSVAARGDLVVPTLRSYLPGAANVVVTLDGLTTDIHGRLPGSPQATRELMLAIAGMPPTCRELRDVVIDHTTGTAIGLTEDAVGAFLATLRPA